MGFLGVFFLLIGLGPEPEVRLTDATAASGIRWKHGAGSPRKTNIREQIGSGVALLDYDRDGWLDIYLLTGPAAVPSATLGNRLYRNNRDGSFTDVTESAGVGFRGWSMGACVGDYDGDGNLDLYVTNLGPNLLYRNNGDGTFTDVAQRAGVSCPRFSTGTAFADCDGDGDLDLFVTNYVAVEHTDPSRKDRVCNYYGLRVGCGPRGLEGAPDFLYRNNGDGTFTDVSQAAGVADAAMYYGLGVIWTDIDNDADLDLFVANDRTPNYLYRNDGRGEFEETGLLSGVAVGWDGQTQACMGVDIGDVDADGNPDIVVTNFSREYNAVYKSTAGTLFSDVSPQIGLGRPSFSFVAWGTQFFDVDSDGDQDLFVANGHTYPQVEEREWDERYAQRNQLFLNTGSGRFREPDSASARPGVGQVQPRGRVRRSGQRRRRRRGGQQRGRFPDHSAERHASEGTLADDPKLVGKSPNEPAIGARVTAAIPGRKLTREVRSGGSYLSQNDLRLHFGLGPAQRLDRLLVRWPDGKEQVLEDLPVNRFLTVTREAE